jgi:hypothetical protein
MMMKAPNHWGEFKAAEGELRKRALSKKYEHIHKDRREAMKKMLADLNKATKFYVPNLSTAVENNDIFYPHEPVNLPYPSIAVLCEVPAELMKYTAETTLAHVSPELVAEDSQLKAQMYELTEVIKENKSSWRLILASQSEVDGVIYVRRLDYMPYKGGTWIPKTYEVDYSPNEDGTYAVKLSSDVINVLTAGMEVASMYRPPEGFDVADFYRTSVVNRMAAVVGEYRYAIADITALCTLLSLEGTKTHRVGKKIPSSTQGRKRKQSSDVNSYHVLSIGGEVWDTPFSTSDGVGGGGKRSHMRRGHIRRWKDRKIWVKASFVKGSRKGFVAKDYTVKNVRM